MSQVDLYLDAAERANTRRSYASAIQHFEIEWGGLLPATIDSISRYLAAYAESLSLNTLKHRLAALSRWHQDHGFPDPTKAPKIRQLLKGIRTRARSRVCRRALAESPRLTAAAVADVSQSATPRRISSSSGLARFSWAGCRVRIPFNNCRIFGALVGSGKP